MRYHTDIQNRKTGDEAHHQRPKTNKPNIWTTQPTISQSCILHRLASHPLPPTPHPIPKTMTPKSQPSLELSFLQHVQPPIPATVMREGTRGFKRKSVRQPNGLFSSSSPLYHSVFLPLGTSMYFCIGPRKRVYA